MSTNSLLSLLTRNSQNRTNSLANRQGVSPSFSFMPRSSSTSISKYQVSSGADGSQRPTRLFRVAHLLNVKVKQNYFYGFCKIEQIAKKKKESQEGAPALLGKTSITPAEEERTGIEEQAPQLQSESKVQMVCKGIEQKIDSFQSALTHILQKMRSHQVKQTFLNLHRHSFYISLAHTISRVASPKEKQYKSFFFSALKEKYHHSIRNQIIIEHLVHIFKNKLNLAYQCLKEWTPTPTELATIRTQPQSQQMIYSSVLGPIKGEQQLLQCWVRPKKIKLKEKKIATTKPILLPSKLLKTPSVRLQEDLPLTARSSANDNQAEHMRRFINLKAEPIVLSLPDFMDHCTIFRQFPLGTDANSQTTFQSCPSQLKLSELKNFDDMTNQQYPQRLTPSCTKRRSSRNILIKPTESQDCSPRIDNIQQILKNVQGLSNFKSAEREKKMVNVNLPKNLYDSTLPISMFHKTPTKQARPDQIVLKSDNKENMGERLITERPKASDSAKGGLEEGKHKSTVLMRQRRSKMEKSQQFTARKMKIEIENIINRRNKQLTYRNQGRELK